MDACARIRGVPLKTRASIRRETIQESSTLNVKSLLKSRKELCNVVLELPGRDPVCLTEIHFVCLPSHSNGERLTLQALSDAPADLMELLKSLHVHSLNDEEVLLLKDSKKLLEKKSSNSQSTGSKAICVLRHFHSLQSSVGSTLGLLTRYIAGIRYALELRSLQRGTSEADDDDTNQSVSSIEDDFVTAFEHLEEDETTDYPSSTVYNQRNQRDVASQTVPSRSKDKKGSRIIISSFPRKPSSKRASSPEVSVSVQSSATAWSSGPRSQWSIYMSNSPEKGRGVSTSLTESDESNCSSPSPIIFLDEVGYQKSLKAKLEIPTIPVLKDGVEDSDSEVSEFFDSFDQFDDLDPTLESTSQEPISTSQTHKKKLPAGCSSKYVPRGGSATAMNPQRFDHPVPPANIRKPTPLKPGSAYGANADVPDSPRQVRTYGEETGALFSPVSSSAFSPLGEGSTLEYFWKAEGDGSELRKPQDLCALYKTYSDFANNMSKEILASVCGYSSPVDMNVNKNLSCVCHKEFKNVSGYLMKLSDIQETVTISKSEKPQTLTDGIQRFATDLVEKSLGSAFRDLQKGVSSCTTTLCHLAARLTSSVFQMAFHEIGMRHAYVLKERAINGLAGFLVGEALSEALEEFRFVKKQIFNNTVTRFAADLAEELVFEGIMEVCQFSHPSTPSTSSNWSFEQEEEVVSSYASDLSESVLQEAFIELSQAEVTFTTQAAISVSLDNIHYVSAEDTSQSTKTCNAAMNYLGSSCTPELLSASENRCTMKKALLCMSGIASCVPAPVAGKGISHFQDPADTCQYKSSTCYTSQTSPKKSSCSEQRLLTTSALDISTATQTELQAPGESRGPHDGTCALKAGSSFEPSENVSEAASSRKTHFQNFSGNMVDLIVSEAYDLMSTSKVKKTVEECAGYLSKKIGGCIPSSGQAESPNLVSENIMVSNDKQLCVKGGSDISSLKADEGSLLEKNSGVQIELEEPIRHCSVSEDKRKDSAYLRKGSINNQSSHFPLQPSLKKDVCEVGFSGLHQFREVATETRASSMKDTLEVPGFEPAGRGVRKMVPEEALSSTGRKWNGVPGTPPPSPQQPQLVSQEKQFKQFSKKLKGKLAKEFSPATPPSTPQYQPTPGLTEAGADSEKADFMQKLMRSLSEEAGSNEDEEDWRNNGFQSGIQDEETFPERNLPSQTDHKMMQKGALRYAERLAYHIVSMATEMDTLSSEEGRKSEDKEHKPSPFERSARFSEQTLRSLWTYAGEMAGEVINDVKKMVSSNHCRHKTIKSSRGESAECPKHLNYRECRLNSLADQWSSELMTSVLSLHSSGSSGLSSKFPSCESVTDEYAGYLIRVLKREGGSRELVLDQYASRLAYRSIKSGLAQAARKIKQRSSARAHAFRSLNHGSTQEGWKRFAIETPSTDASVKVSPSSDTVQCTCQKTRDVSSAECMELVNFAESLAYSITCDVTRKLRLSSVRLPKSLTDSCLYKKAKLGDMPEKLIKTTCSGPLLPYTEKDKQYHSTGSLNEGNYSDGVMQVIERYARKIVDDTLEMTLATTGYPTIEDKISSDRNLYAEKLSKAVLSSALAAKACRYCAIKERPFCNHVGGQNFQEVHRKKRQDGEALSDSCCNRTRACLEIPKIHIDLDKRASFAEEMVSSAIEKARRELSSTSLNADSGIGHDGASFAESLTTEIMASVMSNVCQAINISSPGRERTHTSESTVSQQPSLSAGDDSIGSWSNLSFEDEHPDESSSFLHLSDSNGNSSSWSSLGLEGEACEECASLSPSDSNGTEEKETETKEGLDGPRHVEAELGMLVVNTDLSEQALDPQVRAVLQWISASHCDLPMVHLGQAADSELELLPAVLQKVKERGWRVGELLRALLTYCEEPEPERRRGQPLFQWLLERT
ncbi:A-kinase anchor protein 11-like isoform X2 [Megalops cyprinoides]|uniref:A-kinase anchor protein 11-like isoform X2 n=2 Tax=Megalops cyprinoides TaxID=118141 RepID=UPI001864AACC|nr:A-kinase anchor protein 11-like isoform X2 [Megalops cyprinoides]